MVSTKVKKGAVFGVGAFLVLLGGIVGGFWIDIVNEILTSQLVLTDSSKSYEMWSDIPIPMYMDFYMYNWTNAEEVVNSSFTITPVYEELGPYVFSEHHTRSVDEWNDDNNTVTYRQKRIWYYEKELSKAGLSLDDSITSINVIATTTASMARFMPRLLRLFIGIFMKKAGAEFIITRTVRELLFDGYNDTLLDLANALNSSLFKIPFSKFGYFVDRNGSDTYDGIFNMRTGKGNLSELGMLEAWNYTHQTTYYDAPCNVVRGSSGELWAPIKNYDPAVIFVPDFCAPLSLDYAGHAEVHGLEGLAFIGTNRVFDNGSLYPEQRCFCVVDDCLPSGTMNVSACRFGAPIHVSYPHFYLADPIYLEDMEGLKPDEKLHQFKFILEPVTGIPMDVGAKLQINIRVEAVPDISLFENLPKPMYIPTLWFNQRAQLTEDLASDAKLIVNLPAIGMGVFFGLAGIGVLMLFVGAMLTIRHGWKGTDRDGLLNEN